jgi:hypothetical protein
MAIDAPSIDRPTLFASRVSSAPLAQPPAPSNPVSMAAVSAQVSADPPSGSWPLDLTGHWPELPEERSPSHHRHAEEQMRVFEHRRRLDAEQRGRRWNA